MKMPHKDDIDGLAKWLNSNTVEMIEVLINRHTKTILAELKAVVEERNELRRQLDDAQNEKNAKSQVEFVTPSCCKRK